VLPAGHADTHAGTTPDGRRRRPSRCSPHRSAARARATERSGALRQLASPDRRATPARFVELAARKAVSVDLLRAERAIIAALATAADWQSPSILHATLPAAGRQYGRIRPDWNDYKRDRNLDAEVFERANVAPMLDR
jgi:hypothetical protein